LRDIFKAIAVTTFEVLSEKVKNFEASFSNMPPIVMFYSFEGDLLCLFPQKNLTLELLKCDVSICHSILRNALSQSDAEGLILITAAVYDTESGIQYVNVRTTPDAVVFFVFSKSLNDGACLSVHLNNPTSPKYIDASEFGKDLDLLITPQH